MYSATQEARNWIRKNDEITPCEILRPNPFHTTALAHDTARMYLDTHRINAWKPRENRKGKNYCFLYDDARQDMQDMLLKDPQRTSLLLDRNSIVRDSFIDQQIDRVHGGPVRKRVLEIDPAAASDPEKLTRFWTSLGQDRCSTYTAPVLQNLHSASNELSDALSLEECVGSTLVPAHKKLDYLNAMHATQEGKLQDWRSDFERYAQLQAQQSTTTEERANKLMQLDTRLDKRNRALDSCRNFEATCSEELNALEARVAEEERWNSDLNQDLNEHQREIQERERSLEKLDTRLGSCRAQVEQETLLRDQLNNQYNTVFQQWGRCDTRRQGLHDDLKARQDQLQEMQTNRDSCLNTKEALHKDRNACLQQLQKCRFLEDDYKSKQVQFNRYNDLVEQCQNARSESAAQIETLKRQNVSVYNSLENARHTYKAALGDSYKKTVDQTTQASEKVRQDYSYALEQASLQASEIQGIASKSNAMYETLRLEVENARLEYMIQALNVESCKYCLPSTQKCAQNFKNSTALCGQADYPYGANPQNARYATQYLPPDQSNNENDFSSQVQRFSSPQTGFSYRKNRTQSDPRRQPDPKVQTGQGGTNCSIQ